MTDWLRHDYPGGDAPFRPAEMMGPQPRGHDYLDQLRMSWRSTPEATYPDGYLGTINSRRSDRLLDGLKERANSRPYTRGVHKGERIEPRDYYWPDEFNLWTGLEREAAGVRFSPPGLGGLLPDERQPTDSRAGMRSASVGSRHSGDSAPPVDPDRAPMLRSQAPPWSSSRNPGMAVPYPGR
jgi:hypothetical protein